jgi:hypothetical protein
MKMKGRWTDMNYDMNENIKENLGNFEVLSGLKCNVDKSQIMVIGCPNDVVPEAVTNSGLKVVKN